MPRGVVILPSYYEAIKDLPDSERILMYDAMVCYGLYGEVIDLPPILKSMFTLIKPNIDSSQNRHKASTENGKKGGAPEGNQNARKKQPENNQTNNQTDNQDIEKEKEKDSDYESEAERDSKGETPFAREAAFEDKRNLALSMLERYRI